MHPAATRLVGSNQRIETVVKNIVMLENWVMSVLCARNVDCETTPI